MNSGNIVLQIHRDLVAGSLQLPSLPEVTLRVRRAVANPNQDLTNLAKIVQADPAFCGYLINTANSPLYRGIGELNNVQQALSRLGMNTTRNLAMTYATRALFKPNNRIVSKWLTPIWKQGTLTAALAFVMAKKSQRFDPDEALLAALLLDIGVLPLLDKASKHADLIQSQHLVQEIANKYSAKVGATILRHWGMPKVFQEVARNRENWMRRHDGEMDLVDLIMLARFHSYIGTPTMQNLPRITALPAFEKADLGELGPSQSFLFIEEATQAIQEAQRSLAS